MGTHADDDSMSRPSVPRLIGVEAFLAGGRDTGIRVGEFWSWHASDLLSNATRGVLAEFIVARALGVADGVRSEWDAWDLTTPEGLRVEVKSAAYCQSWKQSRPSTIRFDIRRTTVPGIRGNESRRHADVYVFCLHRERDKSKVNVLDLDQWTFIVVPTRVLDEAVPNRRSIGLSPLRRLRHEEVSFAEIRPSVERAAGGGDGRR